jgi:hypothetical protein
MRERRVTVRIDRLVLKGVVPEDRIPLVNCLKEELTRVLASADPGGTIERTSTTPLIRLGRVPVENGAVGSRVLGRTVARAIGKQVKR